MQQKIEQNGQSFNPLLLFSSQEKLKLGVSQLAQEIKPGMTENEALKIANKIFADLKTEKFWHAPKIRFGINTLKSFSEVSTPDISLQDNDMFFLDFGAVFENHESDFGRTYVLGQNTAYEKLKLASENLFIELKSAWKKQALSGSKLYEYAVTRAKEMGYVFNLKDGSGHRIGDFPHHVHYRGNLADVDFKPSHNHWILEVQIYDPTLQRGAFFEDIL
jgi:Xaa-Pro aminopeptidase